MSKEKKEGIEKKEKEEKEKEEKKEKKEDNVEKEEKVEEKTEEKSVVESKKKKNFKKIILFVLLGIAVLAATIFAVLYFMFPKYEVKVNVGNAKLLTEIEMDKNTIVELPTIQAPEGYELVCWVDENENYLRKGITIEKDTTIKPVFVKSDAELVTLSYETNGGGKIDPLKIAKGSPVIFPVNPTKKNAEFLYWVDKNGYLVLVGTPVNVDTTIYAYWFEQKVPTYTIKFKTGTDEKIDDMVLSEGGTLIFPKPTKIKDKMVFKGWLDEDGNLVTNKIVIDRDMTLTAKWMEAYTCPKDCVPSEDGKTCTKTTIVEPSSEKICPAEDYVDFEGNRFCVDTDHIDVARDCARQCSDGAPFGDTEVTMPIVRDDLAAVCCVKKVDRVTKYTCPAGYARDGEKCKKVEKINCTAN